MKRIVNVVILVVLVISLAGVGYTADQQASGSKAPATPRAGAPGMMSQGMMGPGMKQGQGMMGPEGMMPGMGMGMMRGGGMMGEQMMPMMPMMPVMPMCGCPRMMMRSGMGMSGGPMMNADAKTRGQLMQLRARMMREMADWLDKRGKEIEAGK